MRKLRSSVCVAAVSAALAIGGLAAGGAQAAAPSLATASAGHTLTAPTGVAVRRDNIIRPRATICQNQAWTSGNGRASLRMQEDGNFVLYKDGRAAWQAPNAWSRGNCAVFQEDGNFVVYDGAGKAVWAAGTWHKGAYLAVQDDGNVVVYNSSNRPVWATNTGD
ncbi:hypothetical protein PZB75_25620 [Streptomyces sp. AM 4-1-1]|uniref:hypothetical protein n=1 Tax=Streptomyces sp. AM 4-1-1 TaxID=3028710 RepID=UPI0023B8DEF0|nr:hypothetical protein [Streptomyces sp. AM 4-1-1]WEH36437.1 hypothetical protein PZB75_25620 [Streptomyces sp. AM 4-1-1]